MNIQSTPPPAGHNSPPDPIDDILAPYGDFISEAESWLDGEAVSDEGQMRAVDALTGQIKAALKDLKAGEKSAAAPLHDAWKSEKARWKPTIDDVTRVRDGLVSAVSVFKAELAEKKRAEERVAWETADKLRREAEENAQKANAADIEALREAAAAAQSAQDAKAAASAQSKGAVKGMRLVWRFEVTNMRDLVNWIAKNDKDAMADFATEYARRHHKTTAMDGVSAEQVKEAF